MKQLSGLDASFLYMETPSQFGHVSSLSLFDRFYTFARGGIDTRDVVFLVLFSAVFLSWTLLALGSRRWRGVR